MQLAILLTVIVCTLIIYIKLTKLDKKVDRTAREVEEGERGK